MKDFLLQKSKKSFVFFLFVFLLLNLLPIGNNAFAGVVYDQDAGTWTNTFTDEAGISSKSNAGVNSNALKLTNAGGGYTPPYNTSGYAITTSIIPTSIAEWVTITVNKTTPANTSVTIQVLDEGNCVFPDTLLSGNTSGFTSSSIDISTLPPDRHSGCASPGKIARLRLKITLATSDTNVTPEISSIVLTWTTKQGDLTASPLANTAWPVSDTNQYSTRHAASSLSSVYPALRWVKDQGVDSSGTIIRGSGDVIYNKTQGSATSPAKLSAINKNTGSTTWERNISGYSYSSIETTLSDNGTLYLNDLFSDILLAYDTTDSSLKWTYQFSGGHGNSNTNIGSDGTIYAIKDDAAATATVYAFNPDGSVKWTRIISVSAGKYISESQISLSSNGNTLYFGTSVYTFTPSFSYLNEGKLYALNTSNGTDAWTPYNTGDIRGIGTPIVVGGDGVIYVASAIAMTQANYTKKVYAINPNGTLKWERSIGISTDGWTKLSLRSDNILLADRSQKPYDNVQTVEAMDTSDGTLLWSVPRTSVGYNAGSELFTDNANGFFVKSYVTNDHSEILYYDSSGGLKWKLLGNNSTYVYRNIIQDEDGYIYGNLGITTTPATNTLFAITPWIITPAITNSGNIYRGDTVNFSITTSIQETNLLTDDTNKMQIVMDDATVVPLTYDSTDGNGNTVWVGSYTVPADYSYGTHSYTVQSSHAGVQTDVSTNFASPATDSLNTGLTQNGSFTVSQIPTENPVLSPIVNSPTESTTKSKISQLNTDIFTEDPDVSSDNEDVAEFINNHDSKNEQKKSETPIKKKFADSLLKPIAFLALLVIVILFIIIVAVKRRERRLIS